MHSLRMRGFLLCALLLVALSASACTNYHTIGAGPDDVQSPTKSSGVKTLPTPTKRPVRPVVQPTPPLDTTLYCRLSDLTPVATWTADGDAMSGSLTLANYWDVPCTLKGQPMLGLTDEGGGDFNLLVMEPTRSSNPPHFLFKPGAVAEVGFTWVNWCFGKNGAMRVTVTMAGEGQPVLYVPVRDPQGNLLSTTPPCKDQKARSMLTVGTLKLIK